MMFSAPEVSSVYPGFIGDEQLSFINHLDRMKLNCVEMAI